MIATYGTHEFFEREKTVLRDVRREAPSLPYFVRGLVGMDRAAAQAAFSGFLNDRSLTPQSSW